MGQKQQALINPNDPRYKRQGVVATSQSTTTNKPTEPNQAPPVQSSLPPMPQQKRADLPVSYQQQAGAVVDPRFSQAITQKYTQELQQKQQAFAQQQAEYQKQLQQAQSGLASTADIQTQLNVINNPASTPEQIAAATAQYEKLMGAQAQQVAQSEEYKRAQAELAALTKLSGEQMALKYGVGGGALTQDLGLAALGQTGLQPSLSLAQKYAMEAGEQQEAAQQQAMLTKAKEEELKKLAIAGSAAAQSQFMQQLQKSKEKLSKEKDAALDQLKGAIYLGQSLSIDDLELIKNKLGIEKKDLQGLKGLDIKQIEGIGKIRSIADIEKIVEELENKKLENKQLTPEQEKFLTSYNIFSQLERNQDETSDLAYADKSELAKINALRGLTGQTSIEESALGTGKESGLLDKSLLSKLKGDIGTEASSEYEDLDTLRSELEELKKARRRVPGSRGAGAVRISDLPKNDPSRIKWEKEIADLEEKIAGMSDIYKDISYYDPEEVKKSTSMGKPSKGFKNTVRKKF